MYLLDTNIVSELDPSRGITNAPLAQWINDRADTLFLSVITITEIEAGIANLARRAGARRVKALTRWLDGIVEAYADRMLPVGPEVARLAGRLWDRAIAAGGKPELADVLIAASADHHRLTVLTRNLRHFQWLGVAAVDPIASLPD
ncbi:MAG: type II toxin-antitoxin system VapC family toxin [Alphaproteobacteria bacterium]|nr:type II toxin-antitoxin system VapC family toxin [Alphaproteobacteria bacterium]